MRPFLTVEWRRSPLLLGRRKTRGKTFPRPFVVSSGVSCSFTSSALSLSVYSSRPTIQDCWTPRRKMPLEVPHRPGSSQCIAPASPYCHPSSMLSSLPQPPLPPTPFSTPAPDICTPSLKLAKPQGSFSHAPRGNNSNLQIPNLR